MYALNVMLVIPQVSITLLRPWKCDLLLYLTNHMDMSIKVERKKWNGSNNSEDENSLDTTRDVVIEETISDYGKSCIADTSKKSSSETQDITLNEDMISGNLVETALLNKSEAKQMSDTESLSSIDTNIILNKHLICSTPQSLSEEEDCFISYKQLIIPQETKYIELKLCCNRDPITSFAQLAENNDNMFSNVNIYVNSLLNISDIKSISLIYVYLLGVSQVLSAIRNHNVRVTKRYLSSTVNRIVCKE